MGNKTSSQAPQQPPAPAANNVRSFRSKFVTGSSTISSFRTSSLFEQSHSMFRAPVLSSCRPSLSHNHLSAYNNDYSIRPSNNIEDILRESDAFARNQSQSVSSQTQAITHTSNFSNQAYDIYKSCYLAYRTTPADQTNFDERLNQNVNAVLKETDAKLRKIQDERAKLEASHITDRPSKRPMVSNEACLDQSDRYAKLKFWDMKYFKPKPERPELTDEMILLIKDASRYEPASEPLVDIDGVQILRKDMRTLTNLNWLNDEIINAYMHLIFLRGMEPKRRKVYAFNTFFYGKLRESGYNSVRRWTRKVDIFSYDFLLVPVHLGNHWCLAFINFLNKKICYYDSMGGSTNGCCDTLLDYLRYESNDKKKQELGDENWKTINCYSQDGIPQQMNGSDCGVFACQYAEHLTREAKLNFKQEHMPYFRKKMIYEIMTKRILE